MSQNKQIFSFSAVKLLQSAFPEESDEVISEVADQLFRHSSVCSVVQDRSLAFLTVSAQSNIHREVASDG